MKICENIYSVGAIDDNVRIFHGYAVPSGTTYNAFLIVGKKNVLIDFVKAPFADVLLRNIESIIGNEKLDYIICNHVEEDHSGALPAVMEKYPNTPIYCTANAKKELEVFFKDTKCDYITVKAEERVSLGDYTYVFLPMPMVHWPDSMSTYIVEKEMLFSNDALGQHIAFNGYDYELGLDRLLERAADYYANIVMPYGLQVNKLLTTLSKYKISMVLPSHGAILHDYITDILSKYTSWAAGEVKEGKVVIAYDSMWGTTAKMAEFLHSEYAKNDCEVYVFDLAKAHYSMTMKDILDAKYIFIGSPTLNNNMMPSVSALLTYIKGLRPKNKIAMAFGSYGWSGESIGQINAILSDCGFTMLEPRKIQWKM